MARLFSFLSIVMLLPAVAHANNDAVIEPAIEPASAPTDSKPVSHSTAVLLPTAITVGSLVAIGVSFSNLDSEPGAMLGLAGFAGLTLGPSAGNIYVKDWGSAALGTAIRTAGVVTMFVGFAHGVNEDETTAPEDRGRGVPYLIIGGATLAGGVVYSIVTASNEAKRLGRRGPQLSLTPAPILGPQKSIGLGAALSSRF